MADDKEGDSRGEGRGRLWHGLKTMIFGEPEPSLRDQIEDAIDEHEEEGGHAPNPAISRRLSAKCSAICFILANAPSMT